MTTITLTLTDYEAMRLQEAVAFCFHKMVASGEASQAERLSAILTPYGNQFMAVEEAMKDVPNQAREDVVYNLDSATLAALLSITTAYLQQERLKTHLPKVQHERRVGALESVVKGISKTGDVLRGVESEDFRPFL